MQLQCQSWMLVNVKTRQTNWWHHPPAIYRNKQGLEGVGDILEQVGCSTYALLDADFHH